MKEKKNKADEKYKETAIDREFEKQKKRIEQSNLKDKESLIRYFAPIYYVEFKILNSPKPFRVAYYDKDRNRRDAYEAFHNMNGIRLIEKSMYSGHEEVIMEKRENQQFFILFFNDGYATK